jgi:hypothetical protein
MAHASLFHITKVLGARMRSLILVVLAVFAAASAHAQTPAEKRVALIIANSNYLNTSKLPNAANDAKAVSAALSKVNFKVEPIAANLTQAQMLSALTAFAAKARDADVALVYYAGHGVEVGGTNYLVPVDAKFASPDDVDFGAVPLDLVMKSVQRAKRLKIVILDSCRDNPFISKWDLRGQTRSVGARGLAPVEPGGETLVAYAAKAGSTAADGPANGNSPFAAALVKFIAQPGVELSLTFRKIRDEVMTATKGRQEPFTYGSLGGREFYFVPGKPAAVAMPTTAKGWADRVNEVGAATTLERMTFLFGPPTRNLPAPEGLGYKDVSLKVFKAGPWDLFWIGNVAGGKGMGIFPNAEAVEGPMAKDATATGIPLSTLAGANQYRGGVDITFADAQTFCAEGNGRALEWRAATRAVGTPNCYFGKPGLYLYYAFAFERKSMAASSAACGKEMAALNKTKFSALKCKADWEPSAYAMYADWSDPTVASKALEAVWNVAMDF